MLGTITAALDRAVSLLPQETVTYNGVTVPRGRLLEIDGDRPEYGEPSIGLLREHVRTGDRVTIVGGGYGVSSVVAARHAGAEGDVIAYEAHSSNVERARRTATRNSMSERVDIRHATISIPGANSNFGSADGAAVDAVALPAADVGLVDCEGAEEVVVPRWVNGGDPPATLLVEVHEQFGSDGALVAETLANAGYTLECAPVDGSAEHYVLTGVRD